MCDVTLQRECPRFCTCTKRPSNLTFAVSCLARSLSSLPDLLPNPNHPPPRIGRFQLDFSKSNIRTLDFRDYFGDTAWIDLSKSKIRWIQEKAWKALSQMEHVDLSWNNLTVLPTFLASENTSFRWLAIYENPLRCTCDDKWIAGWLRSLGNRLFTPCYHFAATCHSPYWQKSKNVLKMTEDDFCTNPSRERVHLILEVYVIVRPQSTVGYTSVVASVIHSRQWSN